MKDLYCLDISWWDNDVLYQQTLIEPMTLSEFEAQLFHASGHSIDTGPIDVSALSSLKIHIRRISETEEHHYVPHFSERGYCWCDCEKCTLRLSRLCVCLDCPCDKRCEKGN